MTAMPRRNKDIIRSAFTHIIEAKDVSESDIARFFSTKYTQHVDGKTITYNEFIQHIYAQKAVLEHLSIEFLSLIEEDEIVFSNHIVTARKKDGNQVITKVIAQFTVHEEKIISCDELTYMISGTELDKDRGSRH